MGGMGGGFNGGMGMEGMGGANPFGDMENEGDSDDEELPDLE